MDNIKVCVSTHFNLCNDPDRDRFWNNMTDPEWFNNRFYLFQNFTLQSLRNQTKIKQDRYVIFASEIDEEIKDSTSEKFRWYGFHKEEHTEDWYANQKSGFPGLCEGRNEPCKSLIDQDIDEDWVLLVSVATDDMIIDTAIEEMLDVGPGNGRIVMFSGGYFYGINDNKLARQSNIISEAYGRYYPAEVFDSLEAFNTYSKKHGFFEPTPEYKNCTDVVRLDTNGFCQTIHNSNDSTGWDNEHTTKRIEEYIEDEDRKQDILSRFGV